MENTEDNEEINEVNEEEPIMNVEEKVYTKSIQKPKKPRTEKQIEALKKAQLKRKENAEKRKLDKEKQMNPSMNGFNDDNFINQLNKEDIAYLKQMATGQKNKPKQKKQPRVVYQEESSSEEEEVVYVKKPKKKKKAKKKVVVPSSSSEESEEEVEVQYVYEEEPAPQPQQNRRLRYSDVFNF